MAIGDADPAMVVKGRDQTLVSSTVQNKKRFINLESFENRRGDPLEGFGELDFLVAADAARVVGPLRSALGVVFTEVALRPHHFHGCTLEEISVFDDVLIKCSWSRVDRNNQLVVCALIAVNMILLLCAAWIVTYAGLIFLGFGGCRWRSDMAINYYRCPVDVGLLVRGTNTGLLQAFRLRIESSS
ncbi:MAG TPA: type IV secretion system protein [Candidatus Acidoferrum sp.]|nr:type IV secretion system protein [Candidatus Acidoferrum sp.]